MSDKTKDIVNYLSDPIAYKRELYKAFKRLFSGVIKENFLIEMVNTIESDPRCGIIIFGTKSPEELLSIDSIAVGSGFKSINVCKMIVMRHYINTIMMTDYERGNKQKSSAYRKKLTDDIIKMLAVEKLAAGDYSNSSLESFLPIIYYISALCNFCGNRYEELTSQKAIANNGYDTAFNLRMIYKFLFKVKACINLADLRAVDELMIIYRTLIELFMTYAALWDQNEIAINSFVRFDKASFDYNYDGSIPEDIKLMAKDIGANPVQFVNYGWIKDLDIYRKASKNSKSFGLSILSKLLDTKYDYFCKNFGTELYKFYKACNPQIHGTTIMMNFYQLESHIFQNMAVMLKFVCETMSDKLFSIDFKFGNIDLVGELDLVLDESRTIYDWLSSDDKNLEKTNLDYWNRAICSMKMK